MQKLAHDLRSTLAPDYDCILAALLRLLPRHISPEALTALLATFSTVFKFLLAPSSVEDIIPRTWTSIHSVLPSCNPEVQRAFAEVWGSLLRRLKTPSRIVAVELLASELAGVEDACAWAVVFACKVRLFRAFCANACLKPCIVHLADAPYRFFVDYLASLSLPSPVQ
jgi:U3 small nucleolar RNA-associated protein 20